MGYALEKAGWAGKEVKNITCQASRLTSLGRHDWCGHWVLLLWLHPRSWLSSQTVPGYLEGGKSLWGLRHFVSMCAPEGPGPQLLDLMLPSCLPRWTLLAWLTSSCLEAGGRWGTEGMERGALGHTQRPGRWLEIYQASHLSGWWAWHHGPHLLKKGASGELTFTEHFWVCAVLCALSLLIPTVLCGRYNYCP